MWFSYQHWFIKLKSRGSKKSHTVHQWVRQMTRWKARADVNSPPPLQSWLTSFQLLSLSLNGLVDHHPLTCSLHKEIIPLYFIHSCRSAAVHAHTCNLNNRTEKSRGNISCNMPLVCFELLMGVLKDYNKSNPPGTSQAYPWHTMLKKNTHFCGFKNKFQLSY